MAGGARGDTTIELNGHMFNPENPANRLSLQPNTIFNAQPAHNGDGLDDIINSEDDDNFEKEK